MKQVRILFLALALFAAATGCGNSGGEEIQNTEQPPVQTQPTTSSVSSAPAPAKPKLDIPELAENIWDPIVLSSKQANTFNTFLDTQKPEYEFFDLYDFGAALDARNQLKSYTPSGAGIIQNGALNKSAFLSRVKQNNAEFLANIKGNKYAALADGEFDKVFGIVCTGIEELLKRGIDEKLLDEKLGDLKILTTTMSANGIMTHQDTVLAVNLKSVEAFQKSSPDGDKFTSTILHEVMHLGQVSSDGERLAKNINVRVGPCIQWEDTTPYALFWEWYVEGSAEHLKMDILGDKKPSVYEPYVRSLDAMSVALLPVYTPETIYQQTLYADLNAFFTLFGADERAEKIEIMQMMSAFDVALAQPDSFTTAYKERHGKVLEERHKYNDLQTGAAGLTLSKVFYRELCTLAKQETSLAELFSMITAYETELTRVVRYGSNTERNRPFIGGYNAIQTAFFEQLAESAGMSVEDIRGQYLAWYYSEEALVLPQLSAEKQRWLQERKEEHAEQFSKSKAVCEYAQ